MRQAQITNGWLLLNIPIIWVVLMALQIRTREPYFELLSNKICNAKQNKVVHCQLRATTKCNVTALQIAQSPFDDPDGLPHIAWHVRTHSCASRGIVNVVISRGSTCDRTELGYNAPCNLKSQALHHRDRHERKLRIAHGLSIHVGFFLRHVRIVDPSPISNLSPSCSFTNVIYLATVTVFS